MVHTTGCDSPIQMREVAEDTEPRRKAARERGRIVAGVIRQRIDLRADVALHELIERADAEAPVRAQLLLQSQLADARLEIDARVRLSVALACRIRRIARNENESAAVVCASIREPARKAALLEVVVTVERLDDSSVERTNVAG